MYLSEECSTHSVVTIHADTVHGSTGDFYAPRAVTPFEKRNHYIVANLIVVVHSAELLHKQHETLSSQNVVLLEKLKGFLGGKTFSRDFDGVIETIESFNFFSSLLEISVL